MKNFKIVFAFTFLRMIKRRGYKILTVVMALLFFAVPAGIMTAIEYAKSEKIPQEYSYNISEVYVCDKLEGTPADIGIITQDTPFSNIKFTPVENTENAKIFSGSDPRSLILVMETNDYGRVFNLIVPESTELTDGDTAAFSDFLSKNSTAIMLMKSDITLEQFSEMMKPTVIINSGEDGNGSAVFEIFEMIAPLIYTFLIYFLLIFYSQGVATSIVTEKSSKLMDTLLLSTKPTELILGKMLANSLAGILQFTVWVLSVIGGFATGTALVRWINPESNMSILSVFDMLSEVGGLFSVTVVIIAVLFTVSGFLLYCALSAIGGAISEKAEDLSANNVIFTGIMAVSFLAVIFTNPIYSGFPSPEIILYIPFTAILTVPVQILLGNISILQALISLLILIAVTAGMVVLAGKIYKAFALYKGKFPGIKKALEFLKSGKNNETHH